jgi:hypothetical protein
MPLKEETVVAILGPRRNNVRVTVSFADRAALAHFFCKFQTRSKKLGQSSEKLKHMPSKEQRVAARLELIKSRKTALAGTRVVARATKKSPKFKNADGTSKFTPSQYGKALYEGMREDMGMLLDNKLRDVITFDNRTDYLGAVSPSGVMPEHPELWHNAAKEKVYMRNTSKQNANRKFFLTGGGITGGPRMSFVRAMASDGSGEVAGVPIYEVDGRELMMARTAYVDHTKSPARRTILYRRAAYVTPIGSGPYVMQDGGAAPKLMKRKLAAAVKQEPFAMPTAEPLPPSGEETERMLAEIDRKIAAAQEKKARIERAGGALPPAPEEE